MPPPNPSPLLPSAERLQEIRDTDTASGEDLQFCPAAWQHRRELLALVDKQTGDADERGRRVLTGGMLYAMYVDVHAARDCSVDPWKELSDEDRETWAHMAEIITAAFQS